MTILLHVGLASTKLVRTWIVQQLLQVFSNLCLGRREIETKTLCKHWKTATIPKNILERKADWACKERKIRLSTVTKVEADVEVKHWVKRNSDIPLYEVNQELESQRSKLQQRNQSADHVHRGKTRRYGELQVKKRFCRKNHAKDCQEIEESRTICCEEADWTRQAKIMNCPRTKKSSYDCDSVVDSKSGFTKQHNFFVLRERNLRSWNSEQLKCDPTFRVNPSTIPSPRTMPCRDSGAWCTEHCASGNTPFNNSKNLVSSSHELRPEITRNTKLHESEMRQEPQNSSTPVPRSQSGRGLWKHSGRTCSHGGMYGPKQWQYENWKGKHATIAVKQRKSKSIEHRWLADPQYH